MLSLLPLSHLQQRKLLRSRCCVAAQHICILPLFILLIETRTVMVRS